MLNYLHAWLTAHIHDERGASAVEYGLLCAGVLAACVFAFEELSKTVQGEFSKQNTSIGTP